MIIATIFLNQIDRKKGACMSTGNHLTIRDYFDQVFTGKQRTRKVFSLSPQSANASGTGMFHRMLAARRMQGVGKANVKSTGLTIVDYLANPLGVIGRYQRSAELLSTEAKAIRSPGRQVLAATKASPGKSTASSLSEAKSVPSLRPSAAMPSQKQSDSNERHKIEKSIQKAANKYDLSPGLIKGVIRAESNFQVDVVSRAGAQGLMQLMPATAKELGVTKPFDIDQNIDGGSRYLRKMLDSFGGDVKLALAAYNAGPGTVRKYGGNVPYQETIQYINRVLRFSEQTA
jgi:soluble lytic murein transglycosylase-like protein